MKAPNTLVRQTSSLTWVQAREMLGHLWGYNTPRQKWAWLGAMTIILLSTLASSITLGLLQPLLDTALPATTQLATRTQGTQLLSAILVGMFAATLTGALLMRQGRALMAQLAQNVMVELRADFYHRLTRHNPAFFRKHEGSQLLSIGMSDIEVLSVFLTQQVPFLLVNVGLLLISLVFMLLLSWPLTLASFVLVMGLQFLSLRIFLPQMQQLASQYRQDFADVSGQLNENLQGLRDIQLFGQEARTTNEFHRQLHVIAKRMTRHMSLTASNVAVFYALSGLGLALIYGLGSLGTMAGWYAVGLLVSFAGFFTQFVAPVTAFGNAVASFQSALIAAKRAFTLMDIQVEITEKPGALTVPKLQGHIKFQGVNFSYEPHDPKAWHMTNVSFEILPGEKVAVVGGSGTGKTTLFNLLARFYDVTSGQITIDGYDVRDLTLSSLRSHLGWVAQNVVLFRGTVADNIRFAKPTATMEEVRQAAEVSYVEDFIDKLQNGYHTQIGEMGEGLSGGQKQRLSIARAALANPPILLLDEATSALDNRSQATVMRSIDTLTRGRTTLNIAHRLSAIVNADKIIVLGPDEAGGITVKGIGQHQELLETCEEYYKLYNLKVAKHVILMPIGPMYNTVPVLPTVIGLASAYGAPVYVLDFGEITAEALLKGRSGIEAEYATADPKAINTEHNARVDEVLRVLAGEGLICDILRPNEKQSWIDATIGAIDKVKATHVVAMENVLIPIEELRHSIRTIERKTAVDYILVNPLVSIFKD